MDRQAVCRLRKRALRDPENTLKEMLSDSKRDETSAHQASSIEGKTEVKQEVNHVAHSQNKKGHVHIKNAISVEDTTQQLRERTIRFKEQVVSPCL